MSLGLSMRFTSANLRVFLALPITAAVADGEQIKRMNQFPSVCCPVVVACLSICLILLASSLCSRCPEPRPLQAV